LELRQFARLLADHRLRLSESGLIAIIKEFRATNASLRSHRRLCARQSANPGQVAQLVERSPEKAGVGGSIPSLATILSITYK
jgi:hypothetical protein